MKNTVKIAKGSYSDGIATFAQAIPYDQAKGFDRLMNFLHLHQFHTGEICVINGPKDFYSDNPKDWHIYKCPMCHKALLVQVGKSC